MIKKQELKQVWRVTGVRYKGLSRYGKHYWFVFLHGRDGSGKLNVYEACRNFSRVWRPLIAEFTKTPSREFYVVGVAWLDKKKRLVNADGSGVYFTSRLTRFEGGSTI